ncbi:MAG: SHOCT domain-containing protein [Dermatophilaceae bacterium]
MDTDVNTFWEILVWSFWFFIWISAIMIWFRCIFDLFSDSTVSGWGKAGWSLVLIFLPWIGALIYLIARGRSMSERQMAAMADAQRQQQEYIKSVAGTSASPADQIANAKSLLDSGAITQQEFDALKAKALA